MGKSIADLTHGELFGLKQHILADRGKVTMDTLNNADELVSDKEVSDKFGAKLLDDDSCSCAIGICSVCGGPVWLWDDCFVVNLGLPTEYVTCEQCHDDLIDHCEIIHCEYCGEWFNSSELHRKSEEKDFTPCPHCGRDVVEGCEEREMPDYDGEPSSAPN